MPTRQEPLYVRRSLRVASMTPAKFNDNTNRGQNSSSPGKRRSRAGTANTDETPVAGGIARRATEVDLSVGRGTFGSTSYAASRTPGNQYGRAFDLMDPFLNQSSMNSEPDLRDGRSYEQTLETPRTDLGNIEYPSSRHRQSMNLQAIEPDILAETPSKFTFLPSLSRFTPFVTPRIAQQLVEEEPTPNIVATVKARRKSSTPNKTVTATSSPRSSPRLAKARSSPNRESTTALWRFIVLLYSGIDSLSNL